MQNFKEFLKKLNLNCHKTFYKIKYLVENTSLKFLQKYNFNSLQKFFKNFLQRFIICRNIIKVCQGYIFTNIYKISSEVSKIFRKCFQILVTNYSHGFNKIFSPTSTIALIHPTIFLKFCAKILFCFDSVPQPTPANVEKMTWAECQKLLWVNITKLFTSKKTWKKKDLKNKLFWISECAPFSENYLAVL